MRALALAVLVLIAPACATIDPVRPDGSTGAATTTLWNGFDAELAAETPSTTVDPPQTTSTAAAEPTTTVAPTTTSVPPTTVAPSTTVAPTTTTEAPFGPADADRMATDAVAAYGDLTAAWFANDIDAVDVAPFLQLYNESAFLSDPADDGGAYAACYAASYPPLAVSGGQPVGMSATIVDTTDLGAGRFRVEFDLLLELNGTETVERNSIEVSPLGLEPDNGWGVVTDCAGIVDPA